MTQPLEQNAPEMTGPNSSQASPPLLLLGRLRPTVIAAVLLSCIVLISLYIRVADYGFYEDDYWAIVPYLKAPIPELWENTIVQFQVWSQGRPLNHSVPMWFARIGYGLDRVQGIYFLGFLVQSLNAFLFYLLLRRWLDGWSAILGGILLILIPADTTHILIVHSAQLHASLTYLLVALLIRRSRFWPISYPISALSLLSYETAFLPFIVFPLFFGERSRRILRWLGHLLICGTVLVTVFGIRLLLSDSRAHDAVSQPGDTVWRMISSLWLGPETSLKILLKAVLEGPHGQPPFAFVFAALVVVLLLLGPRFVGEAAGIASNTVRSHSKTLFFAGIASWVFAYILTLINYPPTQLTGRLTSTHVAAVFGLACAMSAATAYFRSFQDRRLRAGVTGLMTLLVAFFVLYPFRIQAGYAAAWSQEKLFWRRIVELCPDITPKTHVILIGNGPKQKEFILANSWADPLVLREIFSWDEPPVFFYYNGVAPSADIRSENGQVTSKPPLWSDDRETWDLDNVILLSSDGTSITRIDEFKIPELPFPLHSKKINLVETRSRPAPLSDFGQFLLTP